MTASDRYTQVTYEDHGTYTGSGLVNFLSLETLDA